MGAVKVRLIQHPEQLAALLSSPTGPVAKDLYRRGLKVQRKAKLNLQRNPMRVDTGRLRSSIQVQLVMVGGKPVVRVGTNVFYALYVHDGTGIYGPRGVPITPHTAKMLSWKAKSGKRVYAKSVKGMRPNPFLKDAVMAAKD